MKNIIKIFICSLLVISASFASAEEEEKKSTNTYYTKYYFRACVINAGDQACRIKYFPEENYPTLIEFISTYFAGYGDKVCPSNFKKEDCVISVDGPHPQTFCVGDCNPAKGDGFALMGGDSMADVCATNPSDLFCAVLNPDALIPEDFPYGDEDTDLTEQPEWGCAIILCLATGGMPSECKPPVKKLWDHLARGGKWPKCEGDNGTTDFKSGWIQDYQQYTDLRVPSSYAITTQCRLLAKVYEVHYQAGEPDFTELLDLQSEYTKDSHGWNAFQTAIDDILDLPRYEYTTHHVAEFKLADTEPRKDSGCQFGGVKGSGLVFDADQESIDRVGALIKNQVRRQEEEGEH